MDRLTFQQLSGFFSLVTAGESPPGNLVEDSVEFFNRFFLNHPYLVKMIHFDYYFADGLKPPTSFLWD